MADINRKNWLSFVEQFSVKYNSLKSRLINEYTNEYKNLSENDMKSRVESNVISICAMINSQAVGLRSQGMDYMADVYEKRALFIKDKVPNAWPIIEREDDNSRRQDTMIMGVEFAMIAHLLRETPDKPVIASDSAHNLYIKYVRLKYKMLAIIHTQMIKLAEELPFIGKLHLIVRDYYWETFNGFEKHMNSMVKTSDEIEKSLQLFIDEMQSLIDFEYNKS